MAGTIGRSRPSSENEARLCVPKRGPARSDAPLIRDPGCEKKAGCRAAHRSAPRRARDTKPLPPPHLFGHLDDEAELGPLLVLGQQVAFLGGSEAALAG